MLTFTYFYQDITSIFRVPQPTANILLHWTLRLFLARLFGNHSIRGPHYLRQKRQSDIWAGQCTNAQPTTSSKSNIALDRLPTCTLALLSQSPIVEIAWSTVTGSHDKALLAISANKLIPLHQSICSVMDLLFMLLIRAKLER